jgi:hypothetical protein
MYSLSPTLPVPRESNIKAGPRCCLSKASLGDQPYAIESIEDDHCRDLGLDRLDKHLNAPQHIRDLTINYGHQRENNAAFIVL